MNNVDEIDHYAVLGVPKDASAEQIRTEWRKLEALHHADPARLREIDAAVDVLLDRAALAESLRIAEQRGVAIPAPDSDSLDFSPREPDKPGRLMDDVDTPDDAQTHKRRRARGPAPAAPAKSRGKKAPAGKEVSIEQMRKAVGSSDRIEAPRSRSLTVPLVIIALIGLVIVFAVTERASKEVAAPSSPAKPPPPTYQSAPAAKAPQHSNTPPPKAQTAPPQVQAPPPQAPALPAEFLQAFQEYTKKSASKAIALALDSDGKAAFGSVARHATQQAANEGALSECTRLKTPHGVRADCRLYAVGDKVVW